MNIDQVEKFQKTLAIFITHAQGFTGLNNKLLKILKKKIHLIEDVCESMEQFNNKKLGNFGIISNFSFYSSLTTIEGGMACTNNKKYMKFY